MPGRVCFDKCTDIRPSFDLVLSAMDSTRDFNKKLKEEKGGASSPCVILVDKEDFVHPVL